MDKPETTLRPTVSVADAMGLPTNWLETSTESMARAAGAPAATPPMEEPTPPEPEKSDDAAPPEAEVAKPEQSEQKPEGEQPQKPEPAKAPKAEKKPEIKKPEAAKPEPAKPAAVAPVAPAAPPKIKVGDKEYTQEELEKLLKQTSTPTPPAAPVAPKQEKKEPTPEEKAKEQDAVAQRERAWLESTAKVFEDIPLDDAKLEAVLTGGPQGVAALKSLLQDVAARSMLHAKKAVYADFNPVLQPLLARHQRDEAARFEGGIAKDFPELAPHMDIVRTTAGLLIEKHAEEVASMDEAAFMKRVGEESRAFISRFQPAPAPAAPATTEEAAPAAATPPAATQPPKPARPKLAPPAGNAPAPSGVTRGKGNSWSNSVVATLID